MIRREPALVASDAERLSALLRTLPSGTDARGIVAALAAERVLLDRGAVARRALDRLVTSGRVGAAFRDDLLRFLVRTGYTADEAGAAGRARLRRGCPFGPGLDAEPR